MRAIPEIFSVAGLVLCVIVNGRHDRLHQNVAARHRDAHALRARAQGAAPAQSAAMKSEASMAGLYQIGYRDRDRGMAYENIARTKVNRFAPLVRRF